MGAVTSAAQANWGQFPSSASARMAGRGKFTDAQPAHSANIEDRREDRSFLDFSVQFNERADPRPEANEKLKSVFELQRNYNSPLYRSLGGNELPRIK